MSTDLARTLPRWLPGALLLAALLWLMRDTAGAMVEIWYRSETFTHAFLVPPIVLWLAWRQRAVLAATASAPVPWLLLPMLLVCFGWLLGHLAAVAALSQFALVTLIVLSVPALLGWAVARVLAFPLAFLYFSVPFGEFTQPLLMEWTADFTVAALRASGVPVYREGLNFVIPSGRWSVVEACSGVRYLIASFMVGTLFAYLNYRSLRRRLVFIGVAILVPIVANWLRAYMIVMIGHLSGNKLAVGVDHLVYGWVFFGIVIGLMFFVGARWTEHDDDGAAAAAAPAPAHRSGWAVAAAVAVLVAGTQLWARQLDLRESAAPPRLVLPAPAAPWTADDEALPWTPGYVNPSTIAQAAYRGPAQRVWLWVGYYRDQSADRKLVTSLHRWSGERDDGWSIASSSLASPGAPLPAFRAAELQRRALLNTTGGQRLRVWRITWTGKGWTTSDAQAKAWQALNRLFGHSDDGAVLLLATPAGADADAVLTEFARLHLPAIDSALQHTRDTR